MKGVIIFLSLVSLQATADQFNSAYRYYDGLRNGAPITSNSYRGHKLTANRKTYFFFQNGWNTYKYRGGVIVFKLYTDQDYKIQAKCTMSYCSFNAWYAYFSSMGEFGSNYPTQRYNCWDGNAGNLQFNSNGPNWQVRVHPVLSPYQNQRFYCEIESVPDKSATTPAPTTPPTTRATTAGPEPSCQCGKHNGQTTRIVNGTVVDPHEYPFYAALTRDNFGQRQVFCGGSLISPNFVLTAAHCTEFITPSAMSEYTVLLGSHNIKAATGNEVEREFKNVILHPDWNSDTVDNDVALIEIRRVQYSNEVSPVCLPFGINYSSLDEKMAITMGYGQLVYNGVQSNTIHDVALKVENRRDCKAYNDFYNKRVTDNMICTYESNKDACKGDSGGPLIYKVGGRFKQIGIVSWGRECAKENQPGVYAYVPNYISWIEDQTGEDFCEA